jgi:AraC-like DNA-binding protein
MSIIEAGGRGGAIALLLLLAVLLLRDRHRVAAARYCALFAVGVAASLVIYVPSLAGDHALWLFPLRIAAFGSSAVFWAVSLALFDDEFILNWRPVAVWFALVALGFWAVYGGGRYPFLPLNVLSLICIALALWRALAGRAGDLVERRRSFRVGFVVSIAIFAAVIVVAVLLLHGGQGYPAYGYANAFGTLAATFFFATIFLSTARGALFEPPAAVETSLEPAETQLPAGVVALDDPREAALLASLRRLMGEEHAYRDETLGIGALAGKLGAPEYRLRRLINQRLGHRNFSAFLNGYRLDEAMGALADPSQAAVPILTVALDAGFPSIGPFNRSFKARTGLTPSAYRRQKLTPGQQ